MFFLRYFSFFVSGIAIKIIPLGKDPSKCQLPWYASLLLREFPGASSVSNTITTASGSLESAHELQVFFKRLALETRIPPPENPRLKVLDSCKRLSRTHDHEANSREVSRIPCSRMSVVQGENSICSELIL